jgi:hypothetical protein
MMDDGLRPSPEVSEISEANAVDAGRMSAPPATPDQPRDVEQERSLFRHSAGAERVKKAASD